ncbi:MAG TPA: exopolyphosphatase [Lachnospiraceae bacterium]|nr:exopolyphosphatase [Lachnospiraceae bacterium]HCS00772.1 exopolyphosphatase [Lachnospiraceae bacterium]
MKKLFSAIDVGSYELCMKVFELGGKNGIKEIDCVRHRIDIGNDTFHTGMISHGKMNELCEILKGFRKIMEGYRITDYLAFGTSAMRETVNTSVVLDQIERRTGIHVEVLSNSEQRFLEYKGAALMSDFDHYVEQGTAFVDIGGGSTQVTLFNKGHLATTVNLHLGTLRIRTKLHEMEPVYSDFVMLISEIVNNELDYFKSLYLGDIKIENIIIIDDYMPAIMSQFKERDDHHITVREYKDIMRAAALTSPYQIAGRFGIPEENASLLLPSAIIVDRLIDIMQARNLYLPGVSLSDGIACNYADVKGYIRPTHNFNDDIISSANTIARRYGSFDMLTGKMVYAALAIFDATVRLHGMNARDRLLLHISAMLRNVGKYVSLSVPAEMSYAIIKDSEIIGISHKERKMVAAIVQNSYPNNISYEKFEKLKLAEEDRIKTTKLTAILRVATGLARNTQKTVESISVQLKDKELVIRVSAKDKMLLEKGLFRERTDTFEEVFGITPVLKVMKGNLK